MSWTGSFRPCWSLSLGSRYGTSVKISLAVGLTIIVFSSNIAVGPAHSSGC